MLITAYVHAYVPFHNGGAETTLHDLLRAMTKRGHEAVVVLKESPYSTITDYEIEGVKVVQAQDKRTILHYVPKSDVLITHLECSTRTSVLGNKFKVPVVQLIHNNLDLTRRYVAQGCDMIVYNTNWIREDFRYEFDHIPSIVVHPPIIAERYKTTRGKKVTLVNLFESKGQDIFYHLVEKMPDVEFLAVEGGYGEQIIKEYPNLTHMKNDFDIRNIFKETKIILMPSKYESYGRVACEALASGIPSIVSPTPGLKEALGDAGTYVTRDSLEGWEKALRGLLTPRKYGTLSRVALERSNQLDVMAKEELDSFVLSMEQLTFMYRRMR